MAGNGLVVPNTHSLLAPLTDEQRLVVDLLAEAFLADDYQWPFYDHIERELDRRDLDAQEILLTFPTLGPWNYCAVHWNRNDSPEAEVALTVVGMSHSPALRNHLDIFFELLAYLITRRKERPGQRREVITPMVTSEEFAKHWLSLRRSPLSPRLTMQLKEHDYPLGLGSGGSQEDGSWNVVVTRRLLAFAGVDSIDSYVAALEELGSSPPATEPVLVSPFSLVGSLDFFNAVWALTHNRTRLFNFVSADRTTRLAWDIQTEDEFLSQLSTLAGILREADKRLPNGKRSQLHPLGRIKADLQALVDPGSVARVSEAIETLEAIIVLRDAGQHPEASDRGLRAADRLGLPHQPRNWTGAWQRVSTLATNALNTLQEELNAVA